jgi:hypothetical protein
VVADVRIGPERWTFATRALGSLSRLAILAFNKLAGLNLTCARAICLSNVASNPDNQVKS